MKKTKFTKIQARLLEKMRGVMLRTQHDDPRFFLDGDAPVNARTVKALERRGAIALSADGLFGGDGQTYALVSDKAAS